MNRRNFLTTLGVYLPLSLSFGTGVASAAQAQCQAPDNELDSATFAQPQPPYLQRYQYDQHPQNFFDLRIPEGEGRYPLAILIHGGYWRSKYDLQYLSHLAAALTKMGIASANIEYRRVGDVGGGYPGTFLDVANCIDRLPQIIRDAKLEQRIDLNNIVLIGHSAGGHLAAWAASRASIDRQSVLFSENATPTAGFISLAGVLDLDYAIAHHLSDNAALGLLIGPSEVANYAQMPPDKMAEFRQIISNTSPAAMLPVKTKAYLVHGMMDDSVPMDTNRFYYQDAIEHEMDVYYQIIECAGHFDIVDPQSPHFSEVEKVITLAFAGHR
ncbi:alpha/beta hydrolase family protein [Serratia microhaemolytica]|uniref:alpha/beta hydrolase family protein n=1 Tax=Serratia microhaemolytica TaxID=2675110 RepID=UPI000FDD2197|nr:alpha/beta hydrolase [Serratia microhaemolytica]